MLEKLREIRGRFPKVFWVAQTFEMMERGAYYSMMPIIVYHAIYNVGLGEELGAVIAAFMYPFQYGLPLFTGALAEKVGYKKQMIFAFIFLTSAYFYLAMAFNTFSMVTAMMAVGVGIGSYKPLISATVAKCTTTEDRNLAYSVYYLVVNLAAFVFPLMFYFLEFGGYLSKSDYYIVFAAAGVMVAVNIFTSIFVFQEVPRSGKVKTVQDVVDNVKIAMKDFKFVVMVFLIGGFWALYSTMLYALPIIIFGFRWYPWFLTPMLLGVFNPLTIIALGMPLGKFSEKVESMRVLLAGLLIYLIGLTIICFSLQVWTMVIFGIFIVSIGEFLVAPGYLAFISKLAPKENVSAYIGCNFISYMIGLLGGTIVFGLVVAYVAVTLEMPYFFYGILIAFGLFLLFAFIIYYQTWGQDVIARAKKIRELEEGVTEKKELFEDYKEPIIFRLFDNKILPVISLLLIPIILFSTFSMGTFHYIGPVEEEKEKAVPLVWASISDSDSSYTPENSQSEILVNVTETRLFWFNCTLTWRDESSNYPRGTNDPDEFKLTLIAPNGDTVAESSFTVNPQDGEGRISIESPKFDYKEKGFKDNYIGDWTILVETGDCGDDSAFIPLFGIRTTPDDGNAWSLNYVYTFLTPKEES